MVKRNDIHILLEPELRTRLDAQTVRARLDRLQDDCQTLVFDFGCVKFMGRSFADEFYNLFLKDSDKNIKIINQSEEVRLTFSAVESTQNKSKQVKEKGKIKRFSNIDDLSAFLCSL